MTRSTWATLLTLAMVWQALMWLTPWGQSQKVQDMVNVVAHVQSVDHHHHEDQFLHVDASADSQAHHHASETVQTTGLLPALPDLAVAIALMALPVTRASAWASAWLNALLRPPQAFT